MKFYCLFSAVLGAHRRAGLALAADWGLLSSCGAAGLSPQSMLSRRTGFRSCTSRIQRTGSGQLQCAAFLASLPVGSSRMRDQPRCLPRWQAGSLPLSRRGDTLCALLSRSVLSSSLSEWTVPHQAPLSMGFSRQEHWSGLPCPPPGDLPNPGI